MLFKILSSLSLLLFLNIILINGLATVIEYDVKKDNFVCLKCPNDANVDSQIDSRVAWSSYQPKTNTTLWMCNNNIKLDEITLKYNIKFSCGDIQMCLYDFKEYYPLNYECKTDSDVFAFKVNYYVPLEYLNMRFDSSYINIDDTLVTLKENSKLNVSCEVPLTNPISQVRLLAAGNQIIEKSFQPIGTKLIYSYELDVTRKLQMKSIVCQAHLTGISDFTAARLDIRHKIDKIYHLDVQYIPICTATKKVFNTGINQSVELVCVVIDANPNVTKYSFNGPLSTTPLESTDGRLRITPRDMSDFGKYDCYPRNSAGTGRCEISLALGGYPEAPFDCKIDYNHNSNNKTTAQINCQIGFNQGGTKSEFVVYERLRDGTLKHSGSVNVYETKQKEVGYLTKEVDESKYYEFVVMQTNNYGNSSMVTLSIGYEEKQMKTMSPEQIRLIVIIASCIAGCLFLCLCCCCCCSNCYSNENGWSSSSSTCKSLFCPCCVVDERQKQKGTYRNVADILNPFDEDLNQTDLKEHQSLYTPINHTLEEKQRVSSVDEDMTSTLLTRKKVFQHSVASLANENLSSFRNELYQKVKQHGNELEKKLQIQQHDQMNDNDHLTQQHQVSSYETTSSSSYTSNTDLIKPSPYQSLGQTTAPTIIKPKPRSNRQPSIVTITDSYKKQQSTPSTSITDLSSFTYTPTTTNHTDDKQPLTQSRTNTLARNRNIYQTASDVITSPKVSYLLNNFNGESTLLRKQRQNIVSDC